MTEYDQRALYGSSSGNIFQEFFQVKKYGKNSNRTMSMRCSMASMPRNMVTMPLLWHDHCYAFCHGNCLIMARVCNIYFFSIPTIINQLFNNDNRFGTIIEEIRERHVVICFYVHFVPQKSQQTFLSANK